MTALLKIEKMHREQSALHTAAQAEDLVCGRFGIKEKHSMGAGCSSKGVKPQFSNEKNRGCNYYNILRF